MRVSLVLTALLASLAGASSAQQGAGVTPPELSSGNRLGACIYPQAARDIALSGCCAMHVSIDVAGNVVASSGECSDPIFYEPTRRCLAAQKYRPAMQNGHPVASPYDLDFEWRASKPPKENPCGKTDQLVGAILLGHAR
jgi:hypothetical protein